MNEWRTRAVYAVQVALIATGGWCAFAYVPVEIWIRSANGLFVTLSILAAAVLVRLARPSPFSNPDVFTDDNIGRYFEALLQVGRRLSVIFASAIVAIIGLLYASARFAFPFEPTFESQFLSGFLGVAFAFIALRLISVVSGDLGFIKLQRRIVEDCRRQKAVEAATAVAAKPSTWKSAGGYG